MYLDTSVTVKLYFPEENSDAVSSAITEDDLLYSSELLITEFNSAISRKLREKVISRRNAKKIINKFQNDLNLHLLQLYPVSKDILVKAGNMVLEMSPEIPLRTLDAIHLTTCVEFTLFPLFTNDSIMLKAADKLGIDAIAQ